MKSLIYDYGRINCMSCPSQCELKPNASLRVSFCQDYCFCTWPEGSGYFSLGIMEGLLKQNYNNLYLGCIFVDFSISHLRFFTNERWIDYLIETKLKIVIVCDKYLKPLANYWFKHSKDIFLVIYQQDRLTLACEKLKKRFIYQRDAFFGGESLSELEFAVLSALISGRFVSTLDILTTRMCSAKKCLSHLPFSERANPDYVGEFTEVFWGATRYSNSS